MNIKLTLPMALLLAACDIGPDYDELVREPTSEELAEAAEYLETYDVPLPKDWAFEKFSLSDGAYVRVGRASMDNPEATILYVPSYTSSQELVSEFLSHWHGLGFEVTAMDLPGQGESIRRQDDYQKTYTGDWSYYGKSVSEVASYIAKTRISDGPFIVMGESMGGHSVIRAAHDGGLTEVDALMPLVPAILPHTHDRPPLWYMRWASSRAVNNGEGDEYATGLGPWYPNKFARETYDHCGKREDRIFKNEALYRLNPELRVGGSTFAYLNGIFVSADEMESSARLPKLDIPVVMITAGDEIYVQNEIAQKICTDVMKTCSLVHIPEATHCLHIDPEPVQQQIHDQLLALVAKVRK